jgi:hypothetical protein
MSRKVKKSVAVELEIATQVEPVETVTIDGFEVAKPAHWVEPSNDPFNLYSTDTESVDTESVEPVAVDPAMVTESVSTDTATDTQSTDTEGHSDPESTDTESTDTESTGTETDTEGQSTDQPRDPLSLTLLEILFAVDKTATEGHWSRHRETRSGIWVPKGFGKCSQSWYWFEYAMSLGYFDNASLVGFGHTLHGLNKGNLETEVSRYRKYHGIARPGKNRSIPVATVSIQSNNPDTLYKVVDGKLVAVTA